MQGNESRLYLKDYLEKEFSVEKVELMREFVSTQKSAYLDEKKLIAKKKRMRAQFLKYLKDLLFDSKDIISTIEPAYNAFLHDLQAFFHNEVAKLHVMVDKKSSRDLEKDEDAFKEKDLFYSELKFEFLLWEEARVIIFTFGESVSYYELMSALSITGI